MGETDLIELLEVGINQDGCLEWLWEDTTHHALIVNKNNEDLLNEMLDIQAKFADILIRLAERMED